MPEMSSAQRSSLSDRTVAPVHELHPLWRAAIALVFIVLADGLFWGQPQGWTIGAFGAGLLVAILAVPRQQPGSKRELPLTMIVAALGLRCVYEPNPLCIILGSLGLVTLALCRREGWTRDAWIALQRCLHFLFCGLAGALAEIGQGVGAVLRRIPTGNAAQWLRGWIVALLLGGLFVGLFALANPLIRRTLESLWPHLNFDALPHPSIGRLMFWLATAAAIVTLLRHVTGIAQPENTSAGDDPPWLAILFSPQAIRRGLILFNLLFIVQTVLDIRYLWGGAALPDGLTYAQYAHQGSYALILATLLAGAFALLAFRPGRDPSALHLERKLLYVWLGQNLFLVISAGWRLWLYVGAYSLTRWRVAAAIWMLLVACGLVWIIVRIARDYSGRWFVNASAATVIVALLLVALVGIDAPIAQFNVRHCAEILGPGHPEADVDYLGELGPEALPALAWLESQRPNHDHAPAWRATIAALSQELRVMSGNWRSWTLRRALLRSATAP